MEIIAHRGASWDAPENTLAAVWLAWEQGADAVEVDVWLTRDGRIAVVHDETTQRYGGDDRRVSELSLAELQAVDVGTWKNARYANERVPALGDVLRTVPGGKRIFVEVKCGPEIVPALSEEVQASGLEPAQVVVIGYDLEAMRAAKQALPDSPVLLVARVAWDGDAGAWSPPPRALAELARSADLDGLDLGPAPELGTAFVEDVHDAGLSLHVWTVNEAELAIRLREAGVDGIATDGPGWLRGRVEEVS